MSLIKFKITNTSNTEKVQIVIRSVSSALLKAERETASAKEVYNEAYLENNTFAVCLSPLPKIEV